MRQNLVEDIVTRHIPADAYPEQWDVVGLKEDVQKLTQSRFPPSMTGRARRGIADEGDAATGCAEGGGCPLCRAASRRTTPRVMTYVEKQVLLAKPRPALARAHSSRSNI